VVQLLCSDTAHHLLSFPGTVLDLDQGRNRRNGAPECHL